MNKHVCTTVVLTILITACGSEGNDIRPPDSGAEGTDAGGRDMNIGDLPSDADFPRDMTDQDQPRDLGISEDSGGVEDAGVADTGLSDDAGAGSCGDGVVTGAEVCDGAVADVVCNGWSLGATCRADCRAVECRGEFVVATVTTNDPPWVEWVSGDGTRALVRTPGPGGDHFLATVDLETGAYRSIGSREFNISSTRLSPSGKTVLVAEFGDMDVVWNEDTGRVDTLMNEVTSPWVDDPALSFLEREDDLSTWNFHVYRTDGTQDKLLTDVFTPSTRMDWTVSSDGSHAIVSMVDDDVLVDLRTSDIVVTSSGPVPMAFTANGRWASWLDAGQWRVRHLESGTTQTLPVDASLVASSPYDDRIVYVVNGAAWLLDLSSASAATEICQDCSFFSFSPDGGRVAYFTPAASQSDLSAYDQASAQTILVESEVTPARAAWSPDGRFIVYDDKPSVNFVGEVPINVADLNVQPPALLDLGVSAAPNIDWWADSSGFYFGRPGLQNEMHMWRIGDAASVVVAANVPVTTNVQTAWVRSPDGKVAAVAFDIALNLGGIYSWRVFDPTTGVSTDVMSGEFVHKYLRKPPVWFLKRSSYDAPEVVAWHDGAGITLLDLETGTQVPANHAAGSNTRSFDVGIRAVVWVELVPGPSVLDPGVATIKILRP